MRAATWVGLGCLAAIALGALHEAATGDPGVRVFVLQALTFAAIVALLLTLRSGIPLSARLRRVKARGRPTAGR